jgi:hypothetical protein
MVVCDNKNLRQMLSLMRFIILGRNLPCSQSERMELLYKPSFITHAFVKARFSSDASLFYLE